jgi:peptidoglycan/LPS O-acetylase OafA/YrhL
MLSLVEKSVEKSAAGITLKKGHICELDGLRAVAVFLVFLNHFGPAGSLPGTLLVRQIGWIGVDVFFVLSGFLITGILLDSTSRSYYRDFYIRRSLRIFPLYYGLLIAMLFWMNLWKGGFHYREMIATWGHPAWLFLYLGNIRTAITGISPPSAFVPMWSLHVEEQFYLIFPFIVGRLSRQALMRTLIAVVSGAPLLRLALWWMYPTAPLMQYMLLPCRMDGLALGALIALRLRMGPWLIPRAKLATAAAVLFAAACAGFVWGGRSFDSPFERTLGYSLFSAAFAGCVLWVILFRGSAATNWLNARPLQFIGKISYGIYLLQMPVGDFLSGLGHVSRSWNGTVSCFLITGVLCVALATLSWYFWERPFLRLKDFLAPAPRLLKRPAASAGIAQPLWSPAPETASRLVSTSASGPGR